MVAQGHLVFHWLRLKSLKAKIAQRRGDCRDGVPAASGICARTLIGAPAVAANVTRSLIAEVPSAEVPSAEVPSAEVPSIASLPPYVPRLLDASQRKAAN